MPTTRTITVFRNAQGQLTHDGKHKYLVSPGMFHVGEEPGSVVFENQTDDPVHVSLPAAFGGAEVQIPAHAQQELPLEKPKRHCGYGYTVTVQTKRPLCAHGDRSNPRIVYP
jgi:hypothetical protein